MRTNSNISKSWSVYLDCLRFISALYVFVYHLKTKSIGSPAILKFIPDLGHFAVIFFFVLSGFLISASVEEKYVGRFRQFIINRATRILTVSIPALLISLLLAAIYSNNHFSEELKSFAINLFFLGHSAGNLINPFWNTPYWSLCYEVMYYIGFAFFLFF